MKENVYLFRQIGTDYVKIGMTKNESVQLRFIQFCTYAPNGAEIVGVIKTDNALSLEKEIHLKYSHKRLNGEFFNLSQNECDKIIRVYSSDIVNKIITEFNLLLTDENINITSLLKELRHKNRKSFVPEKELEIQIKETFKNTDSSDFMTVNNLLLIIESKYNVQVNIKEFGKSFSKVFGKSAVKRVEGLVTRGYYIEII